MVKHTVYTLLFLPKIRLSCRNYSNINVKVWLVLPDESSPRKVSCRKPTQTQQTEHKTSPGTMVKDGKSSVKNNEPVRLRCKTIEKDMRKIPQCKFFVRNHPYPLCFKGGFWWNLVVIFTRMKTLRMRWKYLPIWWR